MFTKPFRFLAIASLAASSLLFNACKKDKENDDYSTMPAEDHATAEYAAEDAQSSADAAAANYNFFKIKDVSGLGCATISKDSTMNSGQLVRTITIDFGPTNVTCQNSNKIRRGKIIVQYRGKGYFEPGASKTITFDNYYLNDKKVEGSRTIENTSTAGSNPTWSISSNITITKVTGVKLTWTSTRTREMLDGQNTPSDPTDDKYSINGSASGVSSNGNSFTANISSPLIRATSCAYIQAGKLDITVSGKSAVRSIDYGNGTCDDEATITVNGKTYTFHLK